MQTMVNWADWMWCPKEEGGDATCLSFKIISNNPHSITKTVCINAHLALPSFVLQVQWVDKILYRARCLLPLLSLGHPLFSKISLRSCHPTHLQPWGLETWFFLKKGLKPFNFVPDNQFLLYSHNSAYEQHSKSGSSSSCAKACIWEAANERLCENLKIRWTSEEMKT